MYMDIPFGKVHWFREIEAHFRNETQTGTGSEVPKEDFELSALARDLWIQPKAESASMSFDAYEPTKSEGLKGVVVARDGDQIPENVRKYYILMIAPQGDGKGLHERRGVGVVDKQCIDFESPVRRVRIQ